MPSKLAVGTVQFGLDYGIANASGQVTQAEVARILRCAHAAGIDTLDTAPAYGTSEVVLGAADVSGFRLITKTPVPNHGRDSAEEQLKTSIRTLGCVPYAWLYHRYADWTSGTLPWKDARAIARSLGVEKVGFSLYLPGEWKALRSAGVTPDIIQIPYNLFDRRFGDEVLDDAKFLGVEVHVRSVFLQGLFFKDPDALPANLRAAAPLLKRLRARASTPGQIARTAIGFVAADDRVDRLVLGVQSEVQLLENIAALKSVYTDAASADLRTDDLSIINPALWNQ